MTAGSEDDKALLIRLDERTAAIAEDIADIRANSVTKTEFAPIKAIVFGAVGLVLIGFMGTLVYLAGLSR